MISSDKSAQSLAICIASALSGGRVLAVATSKIRARVMWTDVQTICEIRGINIRQVAKNLKITWPK